MFQNIPPITKNLLILNTLFFAAKLILESMGMDLDILLGAFFPLSDNFKSYQVITHMFMHGNFTHFFFNMFGLWMFGGNVERALGEKRYIILYFIAGLGAFALFNLTNYIEIQSTINSIGNGDVVASINEYAQLSFKDGNFYQQLVDGYTEWTNAHPKNVSPYTESLFVNYSSPMVGASGALFGIFIAFAMLFPNAMLMLIIPPIPMKAKYFIGIYILIELYLAVQANPGDNVAHYAHIGGALIGFLLLKLWGVKRLN